MGGAGAGGREQGGCGCPDVILLSMSYISRYVPVQRVLF